MPNELDRRKSLKSGLKKRLKRFKNQKIKKILPNLRGQPFPWSPHTEGAGGMTAGVK